MPNFASVPRPFPESYLAEQQAFLLLADGEEQPVRVLDSNGSGSKRLVAYGESGHVFTKWAPVEEVEQRG